MAIKYSVRRRRTAGLTFYFYKHDELIVDFGGEIVLFHAWFRRSRRYDFKRFRKALMYQRNFDRQTVFRLANRWQIEHQTIFALKPTIIEAIELNEVVELPERGRAAYGRKKEVVHG